MLNFISFISGVGVLTLLLAAIPARGAEAAQPEFIQISVLAEGQADYRIDDSLMVVPAVSLGIIEDKVRDLQGKSPVPVIEYVPFARDPKAEDSSTEQEPIKEIKHGDDSKDKDAPEGKDDTDQEKDKDKEEKDQDKNDKEEKGKSDSTETKK